MFKFYFLIISMMHIVCYIYYEVSIFSSFCVQFPHQKVSEKQNITTNEFPTITKLLLILLLDSEDTFLISYGVILPK